MNFGEPKDKEDCCNARLYIGDNFGDGHATMLCGLPSGHEGLHSESYESSNSGKVTITWEKHDNSEAEREERDRIHYAVEDGLYHRLYGLIPEVVQIDYHDEWSDATFTSPQGFSHSGRSVKVIPLTIDVVRVEYGPQWAEVTHTVALELIEAYLLGAAT